MLQNYSHQEPKMLNENTLSKMKELKLTGMYESFKTQQNMNGNHNLTADQIVAKLIDAEYDYKQNKRMDQRLALAKLRYPAFVEQIDFNTERTLDRNLGTPKNSNCNYYNK